ncbi:hypothetical protein FJ960_25645 [Mesorhizobium sp. B2-3-11]|nr:hypothetical protein FJ960_25645 [Mesorhizobium sp. B2-3-11]
MRPPPTDLEPIGLFHARPGKMALRDAQDLMAWPFFSLAKSRRIRPIDFRMGEIAIRVEATVEHGMATIWDADILIWAASQIVDARDNGLRTSRMMAATPHEILTFVGRGTSAREYLLLKAALDRLQSTTVATSIRQATERWMHRFSWINEWKERTDHRGKPLGIELVLPDWFYAGIMVMYAGKVVEQLKASELSQAQHPYTRGLLNCMPKIGADRHPLPVLDRKPEWAQ